MKKERKKNYNEEKIRIIYIFLVLQNNYCKRH